MPITDLTGYTWVANNSLTITTQDNATYNINGEGHFLNNQGQFNGQFTSITIEKVSNTPAMMLCNTSVVYDASWSGAPPFTITFTGGTDATNATLIAWLEANGTLTAPTPTANTYTLTHTLTNVTKGNITLQLTPDTGYELPDTITVTNGTLVSYDKTTGIAVISGDDNTSVSVECVATPSGYNLTINYNHNDDWYGEGWTKVYIKLNGDPTNNNDYDYVLESPYAGSVGYIRFRGDEIKVLSFEEDYTFIINNVVNYTMWGITERSSTHLTANGVNVNDYNNKQKTTLSANAALTILHPWDD